MEYFYLNKLSAKTYYSFVYFESIRYALEEEKIR